jgi:choline-sulfatase
MIRRRVFRSWCAGAALIGGLAGCTRNSAVAPPANVLIVTLDTTRADRLSAYGFQSASMPAFERLAREGIVFRQATTVAPLTLPAHSSLLTGLYPPHHGVRDNASPPLDPAHRTLAEILQSRGFRTAAFVATSVLAADRGLARGFDQYRDTTASGAESPPRVRRPANEVVDDALSWLQSRDNAPFFIWVHLYDAHAPCRPPDPYRAQYPTDPYEGSLAFMDSQADRLIQSLDSIHQLDRTIIVVAADHGESLGEHGEREHGIFLYDSVVHVPLIMRVPGVSTRSFLPIMSLVDVMPTVLGFLQLRSASVDGRDLTPAIRGAAQQADRPVYSESLYPERFGWSPLRALRDGRFTFIDAPRPELYDLETDPFEERNLYSAASPTARAMAGRLEALRERWRAPTSAMVPVPADIRARLASLGYVGGDVRRADATGLDPKDYIETYNATRRAPRSGSP